MSPATSALDSESTGEEAVDITGVMVFCVVTLGLFVIPVALTLAQGPAILSGLFGF